MEEVRKDWILSYKKARVKIEREVENIEHFEFSLAKILLDCFERGDIVLEAGCGTGKFCFWLEKKGIKAIGIDFVPDIVKIAANYAREKHISTPFIIGDVSLLPFRDNCLDGYISLGVIEHFRSITDVLKTLNEAKRVVKPGGKIVITVPNIFVSLRNKILLHISRNKIGFFHEFYTIDHIRKLGETISPNPKIIVLSIWAPIYNIIDGILKKLGFSEEKLFSIKLAFIKLPPFPLLKYFLGYICLIAGKSNG